MIPFILMALSLAQKKQQQNQAENEKLSNSLNLGNNNQSTQLQIPNESPMGNLLGNGQQGGAMNLLGSLFNKNNQNQF